MIGGICVRSGALPMMQRLLARHEGHAPELRDKATLFITATLCGMTLS